MASANSYHPIRDDYMRKTKTITEGDLKYAEKDLTFYEKVSLYFLLFGGNKVDAQYALQRILILVNSQSDDSEILWAYTKINANWKGPVVEALSIIKANKVLRKLGFEVSELKVIFLPHVPEVGLYIHPIVKALYFLCEHLTPVEAEKFALDINELQKNSNHLRFYDSSMLEVYLLDWITKGVINVGKWPSEKDAEKPQLDVILQFLKLNEMYTIKDSLLSALKTFDEKSEDEPEPRKNSSNLNEKDSGASKNEEFGKKQICDINNDDQYIIRKDWAGFILIINQKDFYMDKDPNLKDQLPERQLKSRRGTDLDKAKLKSTFSSFGYIPYEVDECNHLEMLNVIGDTVKRSIVYDSLIVCILSHGIEGAVYGNNSVPVRIQNIQKLLASTTLLGKPKMLIIQACQGAEFQTARKVDYLAHGSPNPTPPAFSDMLTALATVPGFSSFRHIERGSWFIQTLCKVVDKLGDRKHMLDILTAVNKEVTAKRGSENQCMVPESSQTLNKSFFLPRRF